MCIKLWWLKIFNSKHLVCNTVCILSKRMHLFQPRHLKPIQPPLTVLCVDEAWLGLRPCLGNSFRLPMMISAAPHNEVQAWIRLGDDRGSGGVVLLLSGAEHIHLPQCNIIVLWLLEENVSAINITIVRALAGGLFRPCENKATQLCLCFAEACGFGPVWASSQRLACALSPS